jgi:hypothetical protein
MLFLLAVSAQAQPFYAGTSMPAYAPAYAGPISPQSYYLPPVAPVAAALPVAPVAAAVPAAAAPPSNPAFDLSQMNLQVDAARYQSLGHKFIWTAPWSLVYGGGGGNLGAFGQYGNYLKAKGSQIDENRLDRQIDYYKATHQPMTVKDHDAVDDLVLQREAARNTKLRRSVAIFAPQPFPAFFDRRAQEDNVQLAQNGLFDARQTYGTDPTQPNQIALVNARENVDQADNRRDATTFDILGAASPSVGVLGPVYRKRASEDKLDIGYRNLRTAQDAYAKDPSQINALNVKLANLFIRATSQEDDANKDDVIAGSLVPGAGGVIAGKLLSSKNSQDESDLWYKYNKLQRQILILQQQQALQSSSQAGNTVDQQLLGLQNYGPNQGPGTGYPNNRPVLSGGPNN